MNTSGAEKGNDKAYLGIGLTAGSSSDWSGAVSISAGLAGCDQHMHMRYETVANVKRNA